MNMLDLSFVGFVVFGYLLGSLPFAVIVSRALGLADPRNYGSGNPGATNVLRTGNKLAAVLTLLGDAGKGWLAIWLAARFGADGAAVAATGLAAFIGHVFPLFLGFKGGKGVATAAGVFFGFSAWLGVCALATWLAIAAITRYSSLAAISTAALTPLAGFWLLADKTQSLALLVICLIVVWRHQENIRKLLAGTESRIGAKKTPTPPAES